MASTVSRFAAEWALAGNITVCSNPATWHPTIHTNQDHHHPPLAWRRLMTPDPRWWDVIPLCGLCHDEYHTLLNRYVKLGGRPPYDERRRYQTFIQRLVTEVWAERPSGKLPYTLTEPYGPTTEESMSDTTNNQPETVNEQPVADGAVQVNEPQGDVTVNTGGQEAEVPGGARIASDEAK